MESEIVSIFTHFFAFIKEPMLDLQGVGQLDPRLLWGLLECIVDDLLRDI